MFHVNPEGISGIGQVSGDKYQATGVTQENFNASETRKGRLLEETFVANFRIIGQGTGNNLLVQEMIHVTVKANGKVTADVSKFSFDCK